MTSQMLYQGKAKQVWTTADPGVVRIAFRDDATAFNGVKKGRFDGKGAMNCAFSEHLFGVVERAGIATHFVGRPSQAELDCRKVEIIPVEVVVRSVAAGSFCKRYGIEEGRKFERPLVELFYKSDALDDPLINRDAAVALGFARAWEIAAISEIALETHAVLAAFWSDFGIDLIDAKYEFGRFEGRLLLADELTPDGCRLWERGTGRHLDKDVFRRGIGDLGETYRELTRRVFGSAG